ncbi:hypothetical protein Tco_1358933 [Tanacetum coccineum]
MSSARADLLPSPKRIKSSDFVTDLEDRLDKSPELSVPRETSLRGDVTVREEADPSARGPVEVRVERITHPVVPDDILEPAQDGAAKVVYEILGDLVQRFHDHTVEVSARRVQVIESIQRDQGSRIVATGQQSVVLSERISELERDNTRLRGTLDVASQRVSRLQQRELRVRREIRQIRRFRFYDRIRIAGLEACVREHLGYHLIAVVVLSK